MQPPSRISHPFDEQPFDEAVHVLVGAGNGFRMREAMFENLGERPLDLGRLLGFEHAGRGQGARPRQTAGHVVGKQTAIESE